MDLRKVLLQLQKVLGPIVPRHELRLHLKGFGEQKFSAYNALYIIVLEW